MKARFRGAQSLPDASTRAVVDFAGGTGRFDATVGGFEGRFKQQLSQPDPSNPMLVEMKFDYKVCGWMR